DFGGGPLIAPGLFLAKLGPAGNQVFNLAFGNDVGAGGVNGVAADGQGNILVMGSYVPGTPFNVPGGPPLPQFGGDDSVFVAKLDPQGGYLWSKGFGDTHRYGVGSCVAVDGVGDVFIAGGFGDTIDLGGGPLANPLYFAGNIFVAKFDPSGNHLYSK